MNRCFMYLVLVGTLVGCNPEGKDESNGSQTPLDEGLDLNMDGRVDVFYEYDDTTVHELTDKNFDGKIDESMQYSIDTDILIGGKVDENFDGYLETRIIVEHGILAKALVDSDSNGLFDICFDYHDGVLQRSFRFYAEEGPSSESQIGSVNFYFGYPQDDENKTASHLDEKEFHNKVNTADILDCNL